MHVFFRADASVRMGTGHVMRCLTLAEALRRRGAVCTFCCREHPGNLLDAIKQRGFSAVGLPLPGAMSFRAEAHPADEEAGLSTYGHWLGADWGTDAAQTSDALGEADADWLVVDHYGIDLRWEQVLRPKCRKLLVIDDLADRRHDCELLLDQNLGRLPSDYAPLLPATAQTMIGPRYTLLRPEFETLRGYSLQRRSKWRLEHLLLSLGGVDADNVTEKVLAALQGCPLPSQCRITVVLGPHAPGLSSVRKKAAELPWPVDVLCDVADMARLMAECDLSIGAAGTTSWERCCLGVPTLLITLADNQREIAQALSVSGAAIPIHLETLAADIRAVFAGGDDFARDLAGLSACSAALVDGKGAERLVSRLYEETAI